MSAVSASWLYRRHAIRFYTHDVHLSPRHHRPARAEGKVSDGAPGAGRADERSVIQVYGIITSSARMQSNTRQRQKPSGGSKWKGGLGDSNGWHPGGQPTNSKRLP